MVTTVLSILAILHLGVLILQLPALAMLASIVFAATRLPRAWKLPYCAQQAPCAQLRLATIILGAVLHQFFAQTLLPLVRLVHALYLRVANTLFLTRLVKLAVPSPASQPTPALRRFVLMRHLAYAEEFRITAVMATLAPTILV
jgi:hypothetical protein